jgi:protein SCO1/2
MLKRLLFSAIVALPLFASAPRIVVPDVDMTDQSGRHVRAWSDVMKGHTVAINFVFTSCSTICTPMGATFGKVQSLVGRSNVRLVSISIDPANDTPQKMARWGARFGAGASWSLLTGSRENVDALLKAFGLYTPDRFNHSPTVVVMSSDGRWTRVSGIGPAKAIAGAIEAMSR